MSLQAKIVKKLLPLQFSGWFSGTIEAQRARQEKSIRFNRLPAEIRCQPLAVGDVPAEWISLPDPGLGVILYLHGGAYALGSINTHREFVSRLASVTKASCLALDYRLAPEHHYPAALEDGLAAYRWLQSHGYDPSRIILAGDSAGGGLALAMLLALRDAGESLAAGAICISPWTDLAATGASIQSKAKVDPILDPKSLARFARYYAGDRDLSDPLISPHYADLRGLPPLLIQVGTDEILLDDARRFARRAEAAGVTVTLEVWQDMFHVFQLVSFLPETKEAMQHMAKYVTRNVKKLEQK